MAGSNSRTNKEDGLIKLYDAIDITGPVVGHRFNINGTFLAGGGTFTAGTDFTIGNSKIFVLLDTTIDLNDPIVSIVHDSGVGDNVSVSGVEFEYSDCADGRYIITTRLRLQSGASILYSSQIVISNGEITLVEQVAPITLPNYTRHVGTAYRQYRSNVPVGQPFDEAGAAYTVVGNLYFDRPVVPNNDIDFPTSNNPRARRDKEVIANTVTVSAGTSALMASGFKHGTITFQGDGDINGLPYSPGEFVFLMPLPENLVYPDMTINCISGSVRLIYFD